MKRSVLYSGMIASILLGGIQSSVAQKPVGIDFFTQVRSVSNVKTIGNDVFFTIRQASTKDDKYTTNLYQLVDGKAKQLTNSDMMYLIMPLCFVHTCRLRCVASEYRWSFYAGACSHQSSLGRRESL